MGRDQNTCSSQSAMHHGVRVRLFFGRSTNHSRNHSRNDSSSSRSISWSHHVHFFSYPYYIMLLGSASSDDVQMDLEYTPKTAESPERHPIPRDRATGPSPTHTAALPIPGEERASQPNSASDDFSKLPSRRRQVITTFPFG